MEHMTKNKIRRICFYGAAGTAKSTIAAYVFSQLKMKGMSVELVREHVKNWTYYNRVPRSFDQCFLFAKQLHLEDEVLQAGFDYVVTDCPLLLPVFYAKRAEVPGSKQLLRQVEEFDKRYQPLHILLQRPPGSYDKLGRFHSPKEIKVIDEELEGFLHEHIKELFSFSATQPEVISEIIVDLI
jgi:hypothetical protein